MNPYSDEVSRAPRYAGGMVTAVASGLVRSALLKMLLALVVLGGMVALVGSVAQAAVTYKKAPRIAVALVSEAQRVVPGSSFWVGVHQKIEKGWHTYWKNPGDSGLPPSMTWKVPDGVKVSPIHWPVPHRIRVKHLANYGYEREVLLLMKVTLPKTWKANTLALQGTFSWLVCKEECIPGKTTLALSLPVGGETVSKDGIWLPVFQRFRRQLPDPLPQIDAALVDRGEHFLLTLADLPPRASLWKRIEFYPVTGSVVDNAAPQKLTRSPNSRKLTLRLAKSEYFVDSTRQVNGLLIVSKKASEHAPHKGWRLRLSWKGGGVAAGARPSPRKTATAPRPRLPADTAGTSDKASDLPLKKVFAGWKPASTADARPSAATVTWLSVLQAIFFALIGGIILNLMPCVFPVLSIKILHFVEQSGLDPGAMRRHGVAFWLGVQASFSALALVLIGLRASGEMIGWGFQLQLPHVVFLLVAVLFGMALSLSGVFELGSSLMGVGDSLASRSGYLGSFFTGILATIVATPCTAPLMGAAIAYALVQPLWVSLLVFNALGLGMALPYVLLSFTPRLLRWLPRPGMWMERVKQFMAFPLYAAAIWLLWVLGKQAGRDGLLAALIALLGLAFAAWLFGVTRRLQHRRWLATVAALGLTGLTLTYGVQTVRNDAQAFAQQKRQHKLGQEALASQGRLKRSTLGQEEAYRRPYLAELLKEGSHVFLNMTAAWCISCKVNERVALNTQTVRDALRRHKIRYLSGDWTHRDNDVAQVLEFFGRNGVPLYVLFDGKRKRYRILPQVLTPGIVTSAFAKLATSSP